MNSPCVLEVSRSTDVVWFLLILPEIDNKTRNRINFIPYPSKLEEEQLCWKLVLSLCALCHSPAASLFRWGKLSCNYLSFPGCLLYDLAKVSNVSVVNPGTVIPGNSLYFALRSVVREANCTAG